VKTKVFVDGQEGTTGLQIFERIAARADLELLQIDPALRKDTAARAALLNAADIAFLCLPDDAAKESVTLVTNPRTCVIDASTAHRVAAGWAYGVPELAPAYRAALRTAARIANPGCHATAFALATRPLVSASLIPASTALTCFSLTGYTGGGKKLIAEYEQRPLPARLAGPRSYALGLAHKHLPEMRAHTGLTRAPHFTPVVGAFAQGLAIHVQLDLTALPGRPTLATLHAALASAYAQEPFVRVLPLGADANLDGGFLDPQVCNGTNRCDLLVTGHAEQALVIARLDNLGKGASGAAIQCMNARLGLPETTGLRAE
jgi:N-acetyl-gamma-glutamyl-phosphate reductase